jgi:hypothetical protein
MFFVFREGAGNTVGWYIVAFFHMFVYIPYSIDLSYV